MMSKRVLVVAVTIWVIAWLVGGSAAAGSLPDFVVGGSLEVTTLDGLTDDLASGGLNLSGLVSATPPGFADPLRPTAAELRRRSIYLQFRNLVDPVPDGGMGLLWGPQSPGTPTFPGIPFGLIPGVEYKAYLRLPGTRGNVNNVTVVVQIPRHFDPQKACLISAAPAGLRGVWGGIAVAQWGLFRGCAVVLNDKAGGTGFHLLGPAAAAYAVDDIGGVFGPAAAIGTGAQFAVKSSRELDTFLVAHPDRVAAKHAHSQINPERLWGRLTLRSIEFAFWALNDQLAGQRSGRLNRQNTVVIASGVSAGGETALLALEEDDEHLIDGVVVTEPGISPRAGAFTIQFGSNPPFAPGGRSLYDAFTLMGVYAACAAVSPTLTGTPAFGVQPLGAPGGALQNRCASLKDRGLVSGDTLAEQSASALAVLRRNGYAPGQDWGIPFWEVVNIWRSFQQSYSASYGRFAVWENVCDVSFGATDATGRPAPVAEAVAKRLFADGTGAPVFGALSLIADGAQNGPIAENQAVSRSTSRADLNLDGALCFRYLATGDRSLLAALDTPSRARADAARARVRQGMREVQATGRLRGRPALLIQGREDANVFPNWLPRPYYALNQVEEGPRSGLRYIEVTPAQHGDANISTFFLRPGAGAQFAPLHFYLLDGLDRMWEHLTRGTDLPPSQVVRAVPRGLQPYSAANVPSLLPRPSLAPNAGDQITFANGVLWVPE